MKILLTGGTGMVGGLVLRDSLNRPAVTEITSIGRRPRSGGPADDPWSWCQPLFTAPFHRTGRGFHLTLRTLRSFEDELPADRFVRIHKSFIVHTAHVGEVEEHVVHLDSGPRLPIGKSRRRAFWELMTENSRGR